MNKFPTLYGSPAARPDPRYDAAMVPGSRVRLSGKFLANTGQRKGGEGWKVWTVLDVPAGSPSWVVVDELALTEGIYTADELTADPSLKWRRIARASLSIVGRLTHRDCT